LRTSIRKLAAWGPGKTAAELDFASKSHLVFGPTDTGKSYAVQCIRYCLGSSTRPQDIGVSTGYTLLILQLESEEFGPFTIFRDLIVGDSQVYAGLHELHPQLTSAEVQEPAEDFLLKLAKGTNKQLLTGSGRLSKLSLDALRLVSIFEEIQTLERVPLEGNDKTQLMRNRSLVALVLSGTDDSAVTLVPRKDKRNQAKGYLEALQKEREDLVAALPSSMTKTDAIDSLAKLSAEIERIQQFMNENSEELSRLKGIQRTIHRDISGQSLQIAAINEAIERFRLLGQKYENDLQRLSAVTQAARLVTKIESRSCPLCLADISHQLRHASAQPMENLVEASSAEQMKIAKLRGELELAIEDLGKEKRDESSRLDELSRSALDNQRAQAALLQPDASVARRDLVSFADKKVQLALAIRDFERIEDLDNRIAIEAKKAKVQKQTVSRDLSKDAHAVCTRVEQLLVEWLVPEVESVSFDEQIADIKINERKRVSFGKGKRGIFLTAYVVALMEHALKSQHPHIGFVVIDSPLVTYSDPKYAAAILDEEDEALDVAVKDRFYVWLATRIGPGQVIVFENEEPDQTARRLLHYTEFVGSLGAAGRAGFFPLPQRRLSELTTS
jgi:hypothetical protein